MQIKHDESIIDRYFWQNCETWIIDFYTNGILKYVLDRDTLIEIYFAFYSTNFGAWGYCVGQLFARKFSFFFYIIAVAKKIIVSFFQQYLCDSVSCNNCGYPYDYNQLFFKLYVYYCLGVYTFHIRLTAMFFKVVELVLGPNRI